MTYEPTRYAQEINLTEFLRQMELSTKQRSFQMSRKPKTSKEKLTKLLAKKPSLQSFLLESLS